jgi:hypothetical protein
LGFRGLATNKEKTRRRRALRALLLCLYWSGNQNKIEAAKSHYQNLGEDIIKDAVKSFFPLQMANANTVSNASTKYSPPIGTNYLNNIHLCRRGAVMVNQVHMGGNCYSAVAIWLYLGGAVSLRWLKEYGGQPAGRVPLPWTWGAATRDLNKAARIPRGMICRFSRDGALHYTISVGNGDCMGLNQSMDACVKWERGYGPAPSTICSKFKIAGYLATMQKEYAPSEIRTAPCMPNGSYRF